ncbi:MAG TPA: hypothetical protein VK779_00515 [Rhizomicrobium sp.]|nr:hypothetical protein [Rhizomicrobium sp.]
MDWIIRNIDWILQISGVATCSMISLALAPRLTTRFVFGEGVVGAIPTLIVRSWGVMITLGGLLLIYASFHPEARLPILLFSFFGKSSFVVPVVAQPSRYLKQRAYTMAFGDIAMMACFAWYLIATH